MSDPQKPLSDTTIKPCRWDDDWNRLGYLQWHYQADRWHKAGIRQKQCPICGLWRFPAEECAARMAQRATQYD